MDAEDLRALQQPLKDAYRSDPATAVITLQARGELGEESVSCSVETGQALAIAGLHPATAKAWPVSTEQLTPSSPRSPRARRVITAAAGSLR